MESNTGFDMAEVSEEKTAETIPQIGEQVADTPIGNDVSEEASEEKHRIKYNGEILELTLDELKTAAQKGMNYDKVLRERDKLRSSREFSVLDARASAEGLTREQYLDKLEKGGENNGNTDPVSGGDPRPKSDESVRSEKTEETGKTEKQGEELRKRLSEFKKLYPEVTRLPDDVVEDIKSGTDIVIAYQKHEISRLRNAAAAAEQNSKNREKSVGSLADTGASGGRYFSETELDHILKTDGKSLMEDDVWEKAVRSMAFHQKKKKG